MIRRDKAKNILEYNAGLEVNTGAFTCVFSIFPGRNQPSHRENNIAAMSAHSLAVADNYCNNPNINGYKLPNVRFYH